MILNIIAVISDLIHILKIILLCELLFVFKKQRDIKRYFIVGGASVIVSHIIFLRAADVFSLFLYIGWIFIVLLLLYVMKVWQAMLLSFALTLLASMIDMMNEAIIDLIIDICKLPKFIFKDLILAIVSMIFVAILLYIYKRRYYRCSNWRNLKNAIIYILLMTADVAIVGGITFVYESLTREDRKVKSLLACLYVINIINSPF